jgi:hypothetical protein
MIVTRFSPEALRKLWVQIGAARKRELRQTARPMKGFQQDLDYFEGRDY